MHRVACYVSALRFEYVLLPSVGLLYLLAASFFGIVSSPPVFLLAYQDFILAVSFRLLIRILYNLVHSSSTSLELGS